MRKWIARGLALCALPCFLVGQLLLEIAEWVIGGRRREPETPQPGGYQPRPTPGTKDPPPSKP